MKAATIKQIAKIIAKLPETVARHEAQAKLEDALNALMAVAAAAGDNDTACSLEDAAEVIAGADDASGNEQW